MEKQIEVVDFYSGFEGEPELQFNFMVEDKIKRFAVWTGYFDAIMEEVSPSTQGWSSLAYYYHLHEGWYDDANWQIPNLTEAIRQIQGLKMDGLVEEVRKELIEFMQEASYSNVPVVMSYF